MQNKKELYLIICQKSAIEGNPDYQAIYEKILELIVF